MIALIGEGPTGGLLKANKKLKQALRRVLRAAAALDSERLGNRGFLEMRAAEAAYSSAVAAAKKTLKEI